MALLLEQFKNAPDVVVLALPRGGVPVAFEISRRLSVPMDIFLVRKLGVPGHEELAMGAIASGGTLVRNQDVIKQMKVSEAAFAEVVSRESAELDRRSAVYRGDRTKINLTGKMIILVDDGIATGASVRAAVQALHTVSPSGILVAVPVAASQTVNEFNKYVAPIVCVIAPDNFFNVGAWYQDFSQTDDAEVQMLLACQQTFDQPGRC